MNAGGTQRRAAKTAAESIAASSSGKPAARKTSSRDAKTAASKRIGKQAEDEQALCANEFGPDEDAAYKSNADSNKRKRTGKQTKHEKKLFSEALRASPVLSTEPIRFDTGTLGQFEDDFLEQVDTNFKNLSKEDQKSVGRLGSESNMFLLTDPQNPKVSWEVVESCRAIKAKLGGASDKYCSTYLTGRKIIRGVGVELIYVTRTELVEIRAKVIVGGPAKVRACRDRANEDLPTNSKGKCTGGTGRQDNTLPEFFIGYGVSATGGKDESVILVKQKGIRSNGLCQSLSKGGVGILVSRGGKRIKLDMFKPVDPLKPEGVKFLVVRGVFYVEMHTSEPKDWGKPINEEKRPVI